MNHQDKLVQVFSCEMKDNQNFLRGKLYLMEKSYHFCPLQLNQFYAKNKPIHHTKYSTITDLQQDQDTDSIIIKAAGQQFIFRSFFQQRQQAFEILSSAPKNQDWSSYINQASVAQEKLISLLPGNEYKNSIKFEMEGMEIHEIFQLLYDDQPYVHNGTNYQNGLHCFFEVILHDKDIKFTQWAPAVPRYLRTGDPADVPSIDHIPTRVITLKHPTNLPFFGTIMPDVIMTQKLLILNQNSFVIQVQTDTKGLPFCENYRVRTYEKVTMIGQQQFEIESTDTIEWVKKIMLVSNKVNHASAIESKRIMEHFYIPYCKSRNEEFLRNKPIAIKSSINQSQIIQKQEISSNHQESQLYKLEFEKLRNKIDHLESILSSQKNQIQDLTVQQQWIVQINRVCMSICLLILFLTWFLK